MKIKLYKQGYNQRLDKLNFKYNILNCIEKIF